MAMSTAATITSLDGFHATPAAQRADELVRALFNAVNTDDPARTNAVMPIPGTCHRGHGLRVSGFDCPAGQMTRTLPERQSAGSVVAALLPAGAHYVKAFGTLPADALADRDLLLEDNRA